MVRPSSPRVRALARVLLALPTALLACSEPGPGPGASEGMSSGTGSSSAEPTTTGGAPDSDASSAGGSGSIGASSGAAACDPAHRVLAERGFLPRGAAALGAGLAVCGEDLWYVALPSESSWGVRLTRRAGPGPLEAVVVYPDEPDDAAWSASLAPPLVSGEEPAEAIVAAPRAGEFAVRVRSLSPDAAATYDLELTCAIGCERETTRFPIVLVHGWTGFEAIGPLTYFFNVKEDLVGRGFPLAVAVLDPYNSSEVRSAQLAEQVDAVLAEQRARKVDLLGHSQGGIDSRAVVSTHGYGDRVSALVSIGSPHRGTYIMDLALGLAPGGVEDALSALLNLVGAVTEQQKSDAKASFYSLSEAHMEGEFNPANPDDARVQYISYTGRTCSAAAFLDPANDCKDLVDPLIGWGYAILQGPRGDNDGLVTVASAMWGEYRGEMIADHIDEVGQIGGITDPKFDHLEFYRKVVRDLVEEQH